MEALYDEGLIIAIGVSNFHRHHLETLDNLANVEPATDQVESNHWSNNQELIDYLQQRGIVTEAWSPLGETCGHIIEDSVLLDLAKNYDKSVVQVIRWNMQRGVVVLPKSTHKERMIDNFKMNDFELSGDDPDVISKMNRNQRTGADPETFNF